MPSILQWNCRGLRTSLQDLQAVIRQRRPLFVCLQETKLSSNVKCQLKGYSVFRKDVPTDTVAHGGVLLAVHHSIPMRPLVINSSVQSVAAQVMFNRRKVSICSVYLPPGVPFPMNELRQLVLELPSPAIILGDFNAHNTVWGCENTNTRGRLLENFIHSEDLCILNTGTRTHFTLPSGQTSVLDLSLVSPQLTHSFMWSVGEDPLCSDHFPIWLDYVEEPLLGVRPRKWNFNKADWVEFETRLGARFEVYERRVPQSVENFTSTLLEVADECIPKTSGTPRRIPVPWWTVECRKAILERERAFKILDKNSTTENLIRFRKARAFARRTVRDAKQASWRKYVEKLNRFTPVSEVWNRIKRIAGKFDSVPLPVLRIDDQDVTCPEEVANEIARAFSDRCSASNTDPQFLRHRATCELSTIDFHRSDQSHYNDPFTILELRSALNTLRDVSEGPDRIHNNMLRHLPECAQEVLLAVFNTIWERGTFPDAWREATIIPILKPGRQGFNPLDYRPISLTSALCKLMEKMVSSRLVWFLEHCDFFVREQCGFRKHRSTVDHILYLDTVIRTAFKKNRHVGAIFFDIEAAYDTAWRHGIVLKLFEHGIRGLMGVFLQNFLSHRFFRVRVGNNLSERFPQVDGVPQGGVLSVVLFAVMINDIGKQLPTSIGRSLFVDDFAIWSCATNCPSMARQLQLATCQVERWCTTNGFRLSIAKTVAVHFCRRRRCNPDVPVRLYNEPIPMQRTVKFLGVLMDDRLTYGDHFKMLRERCFKSLNILKTVARTSYGADRSTLLLLYRSLIRSKLDYACMVYDSACKSRKKGLDVIHHTAIRVATGAFRTSPISSLLAEAHEPPLSLRRQMLSMRYALKLRQFPSHPTYDAVFSRETEALFRGGILQRSEPFCVRMRRLVEESGLRLPAVRRIDHLRTPPWRLVAPSIDLSLSEHRKADMEPYVFRALAQERIGAYQGHLAIFTDGSKTANGVGCSFVDGSGTVVRSFSLPTHASVFTSELMAIFKAICFIEVGNELLHLILTDSLSALLSLKTFYPSNPLIQDILIRLTSLTQAGKTVIFCWIPSHVGIVGNELADRAARRAADAPCTRRLPLPARDFYPAISTFMQNKWQQLWNEANTKLNTIKPKLTPWPSSFRKSRRDEVTLCRLRIGHTLATHKYLLCGENRPMCPRCGHALSVRHILCDCPGLETERARHFGSNDIDLSDLLRDDSRYLEGIFGFLADARFTTIYTPGH